MITSIIQAIKEFDTIIIHRHVRPDPDAIGSQAGLKEMIMQTYPNKKVYIVGEDESSLMFLAEMNKVEDDVYEEALVIICDTANTARIDDQRYKRGQKIIKIDHHPNVDPYGDIQWVDTASSSTSELICELYTHAKNDLELNNAAARLLYAGIVGDTGRFLFPSTTPRTFQHASALVAYPFDRQALYAGIYDITEPIARLRGYILQNFQMSPVGVSFIKLTKELLDSFAIDPSETSQVVGLLGDIKGMKAWAVFVEEADMIRVRLRSKGPIINDLAAKYHGGGHPLASGATVYNWSEADELIKELEAICKESID
ncbi:MULTISPECIES: bifunctional oligoribonuclease/PAP phosphatase NrnA [unclassified Virgibacillus]|uniref:DHH family phosphoesterase n=1 Tax=unclassified Virgibacillus TaxID=2620237 RepID=UPI0024DEC900|nr:bifunctional oligoribonuclease/PAP phosphatase NrnA [Virgibacillus sp. LDC-1]